MSYYVIADLKLNDKETASRLKMTLKDYNEMLIERWNSVIKTDDSIFVFGNFGKGNRENLKKNIEQLNGLIYIVNYSENSIYDKISWKNLGIHSIWDCSFSYPMNENEKILFPAAKNCPDEDYRYRILTEKDGAAEVYKDNKLSIEAKYWNYKPILLKNIPLIIKEREEIK